MKSRLNASEYLNVHKKQDKKCCMTAYKTSELVRF